MPSLVEIRTILKENKIRGYSHYIKPEIIALLFSKGLLPEEAGTKKGKQDLPRNRS